MKRSQTLEFIAVSICFLIAIWLRISNYQFVFADITGHLNFIDTDCYYYLRLIVSFLENFPKMMIFDPLLDWPSGSPVGWPEGFLLSVALPLKLFGVNSFRGVEIGACIILILFGLMNAFVIYRTAKKVLNQKELALVALFFGSINFLLVRFSCLGEVDHHILEALFPGLFFLLAFKSFDDAKKATPFIFGLLVTFSLFVSSSSLFSIFALFIGYSLCLASSKTQKSFFWFLGGIFVSLIPLAILNGNLRGSYFTTTYPSFFQSICIASSAALAWLIGHGRSHKNAMRVITAIFLLGIVSVCFSKSFVGQFLAAVDYVFGYAGILSNVFEAQPIFMSFNGIQFGYMHANFGYLVYLMPFIWISFFYWKRLSTEIRFLLIMLAIVSIPGIYQKRFSHIMMGLFLVFCVWILEKILIFLKTKTLRVGFAVTIFFITAQLAPVVGTGFSPRGSARDKVDLTISHYFLKSLELNQADVWKRLSGEIPPSVGIWANPNIGHMFLYYTGYGVVMNSFTSYSSLEFDFRFRKIEGDKEFLNELRKNKIGFLVAVDDWKFFELEFNLHGESNPNFYKFENIGGRDQAIWNTPYLMKFAWARLLLTELKFPQLQTLFVVQTKEDHFYNFAKGFKLVE